MRGTVLGFDPDTNTGAIGGPDGSRYDFVRLDWHGPAQPVRGTAVDFVAEGMRARQIYPANAAYDPCDGETAKIVHILHLVSLVVGVTEAQFVRAFAQLESGYGSLNHPIYT